MDEVPRPHGAPLIPDPSRKEKPAFRRAFLMLKLPDQLQLVGVMKVGTWVTASQV